MSIKGGVLKPYPFLFYLKFGKFILVKTLIKNHWQFVVIILAGVGMFFVYSWFSVSASRDLYICGASSTEALKTSNQMLQGNSEELCGVYGSAENIYKFNSPDETLNFFFTKRFAEGEELYYQEPLEGIGNNLIRPRSVNVVGDKVLPGSFMGMYFIYGNLSRFAGSVGLDGVNILFYLNALLAVIGIVFFYLLISLIFGKNIALILGLLAYAFPGWLYFASRSFYHNILFVSLLIIGLYLLIRTLTQVRQEGLGKSPAKWLLDLGLYMLAGVFIGASLITRLSEIGWVALLVILIFIFNWRKFLPNKKINISRHMRWHYWLGAVLFGVFVSTMFVPVFVTNIKLYGAPLSIGYDTGLAGDITGLLSQPSLLFKLLVSPFGWHPRHIALNGYNYLVKFFWQFTIPAVFGFILWLFAKEPQKNLVKLPRTNGASGERKRQQAYLVALLIITIYLLIFYGSWMISDRIDQQAVSIGTSFVRYWLPIYLGLLPFVAVVINSVISLLRHRAWPKPILAGLMIALLVLPGIRLAFWDTDESLIMIRDNVRESQTKLLKLKQAVPEDAIVVLGFKQADKIFFPEYKRIITELVGSYDYESVARLIKQADIYYYHFAGPEDVAAISRRDFEPFGIKIKALDGQNIFGREWLYEMEIIETIEEN